MASALLGGCARSPLREGELGDASTIILHSGAGRADAGAVGVGAPQHGNGRDASLVDTGGTPSNDAGPGPLDGAVEPPVMDGGQVTNPPGDGPRLRLTRTNFVSSEPVTVYYIHTTKPGAPFIGIYASFSDQPKEEYDIKFDKGDVATGSHAFKKQPAGSYYVRLMNQPDIVIDEVEISVASDRDEDGVEDRKDGCPDDENKVQAGACGCGKSESDLDKDGRPDCVDGCPSDPMKSGPGACGCGFSDSPQDQDGDGVSDCYDACPADPNKFNPMQCGCGTRETDTDGDGSADCNDKCPNDPNKTSKQRCGCGQPETDSDQDGAPNCIDTCPFDPHKNTPGYCGCGKADTFLCY